MSASFGLMLVGGVNSISGAGSAAVADTLWGRGQAPAGSPDLIWPGGNAVFSVVAAAFNAATIQLQVLGPDGLTWVNVGTGVTTNGIQQIFLPNCNVRCVPGAATGVFAALSRVVE